MTPMSITETKTEPFIAFKLKKPSLPYTSNVYDSLLPKNEPGYMKPIRAWEKRMGFITPLIWTNIIAITLFHIIGATWLSYIMIVGYYPKWETFLFGCFMGFLGGFGVTAGAHRLWSHRAYKAKLPLEIILLVCFSVAGQNNVYEWVRDHRVHHKHSETTADPHDANRGLFFSHVGWLMMRKHPHVSREGAKFDMSDITDDPLLQFHTKHFLLFKLLFCFILPTLVPVYFWNEVWSIAILSQPIVRYILGLNFTWSVNSFAHFFGGRPYDKNINPSENWGVSLIAMGEGWHNYHHTFPWDYKAAELAYTLNTTTLMLDAFALIGWAYDLKQASPALIAAVQENRGTPTKLSF